MRAYSNDEHIVDDYLVCIVTFEKITFYILLEGFQKVVVIAHRHRDGGEWVLAF
jgi:hypothetical protein